MITPERRATLSNKPAIYPRKPFADWIEEKYGIPAEELEPLLPPFIIRSKFDALAERLGLPGCAKSLANLDSRGLGPERLV